MLDLLISGIATAKLHLQQIDIPSDSGQRRTELVRCVSYELTLRGERLLHLAENMIEGGCQPSELILRRRHIEALIERQSLRLAVGNLLGAIDHLVDRLERASRQKPARKRGEQCPRKRRSEELATEI